MVDRLTQDRSTGQDGQLRQKLDYAGRLPTPSGSLYTVDDIDSQYSDHVFDRHDSRSIDRKPERNLRETDRDRINLEDSVREIDRDRVRPGDSLMSDIQTDLNSRIDIDRDSRLRGSQRDIVRNTRTEHEQFDILLDRLTADTELEKTDTDLRNKSLLNKDKDETRHKIVQPIGNLSEREIRNKEDYMPGTFEDSRKSKREFLVGDITDDGKQPYIGDDLEERQLKARLVDLSFQERRIAEERLRKKNAETEMERKLKALQLKNEELQKEEERKERLNALRMQANRLQAKLWEEQDEDRRFEEKMERMYSQPSL